MSTDDINQKITELLEIEEGLSTTEISEKLGIDRAIIDSNLYKQLGKSFFQDNHYGWYLKNKYIPKKLKKINTDTHNLAKISKYFLDCLEHSDDSGYSCFASNMYGNPDYLEISNLPTYEDLREYPELGQLKSAIRRQKGSAEIFFGYPVRIKKIESKKSSWSGYVVEPILIYAFDKDTGELAIVDELPTINNRVIKDELDFGSNEDYIEEIIQLENELGLTGNTTPILEDIAQRLKAIRPGWKWIDDIDPYHLNNSHPISDLVETGIYNKAIFFLSERSPFTKGLETELAQLLNTDINLLEETSLESFINNNDDSTAVMDEDDQLPLLEPIPLNLEQKTAINAAMQNKLTVVTGPPGTGKSQLITNLIINAIWQDKTVLFASKNNRAVDVVDSRVNAISKRPVMIRTGSHKYQHRLSESLISLLNSSPSENDRTEFEICKQRYDEITVEQAENNANINKYINLRNQTDMADIKFQDLKEKTSELYIKELRKIHQDKLILTEKRLSTLFKSLDPDMQTAIDKITNIFNSKNKISQINQIIIDIRKSNPVVFKSLKDGDINEIKVSIKLIQKAISNIDYIHDFEKKYKLLIKAKSFESLTKNDITLQERLVKISGRLWDLSVKLMPDTLSLENRNTINRYKSLLEMTTKGQVDIYNELGKEAYFQYKKLAAESIRFLPAWSVTSLSARGKIPFEAGMFDLIIFDEASQCDIASALPLLYRARQAVIIGDPKQLKHISNISMKEDMKLLKKNGLFIDKPNWAYSINSLFDLAVGTVGTKSVVKLRDHHRSHADIINFSNEYYYEDTLRIATRYDNLVALDDKNAVEWISIKNATAIRPRTGSAINEKEAKKIVDMVKDLLINKKYTGTLGVVTPFRAQANYIEELIHKLEGIQDSLIHSDFKVDAIHSFQGDERDIIIFSPVLAEGISEGALGFLRNNGNLFNVAITRARAKLFIVGDIDYALRSDVSYLKKFAEYTKSLSNKRDYDENIKISKLGARYPKPNIDVAYSEWEVILYEALYKAGIKTIPQYRIDSYILDLALITKNNQRLDIEVDGEKYHREWNGELKRSDRMRNQRMFELGWDVKRFWVYEIRDNLDDCVMQIKKWIDSN